MDVGVGNPGMDKRFGKNLEFGKDSHSNGGLGGTNREWMLVMEIRVWTENSKRILSLAAGFSVKQNIGKSQ